MPVIIINKSNPKTHTNTQRLNSVSQIASVSMNIWCTISGKHLERPHPGTFKHAKRSFIAPVGQQHAIEQRNAVKSEETLARNKKKLLAKYRKKMAELAEAGLQYDLDGMVRAGLIIFRL